MKQLICLSFIVILSIGCLSEENDGPRYQECDSILGDACRGAQDGEYCLFGFKWGEGNPMTFTGLNAVGNPISGGEIRYSFATGGIEFDTHSESRRVTIDPSGLNDCFKEGIRNSFLKWEAVCNITVKEVGENEIPDIEIFFADIDQSGLGNPQYHEGICTEIAGRIIFGTDDIGCDNIDRLSLHEIGHALGLGHVGSDNVMRKSLTQFTELQEGDIKGIQAIYGPK